MTFIIKRLAGDREEFEEEKIRRSIKKAYLDAGKSLEERAEEIESIASEVIAWARKNGGDRETREIRNRILARLEKVEPDAADAWKRFEERYKKV